MSDCFVYLYIYRFRQLYINTVGFHYADYALKLGKMFTPEEALKLHLVNELVESPSDLNKKAQSEMDKWLKIPGNVSVLMLLFAV